MKKSAFVRACVWLAAPLFLFLAWTVDCSKGRVPKREAGLRIGVSYPKELGPGPFDGRMLLMLADNDGREPRFQVSSRNEDAQPVFGIDVEGLMPGEEAVFDARVFGFPVDSLAKIPPGEYVVQALLHKYETFQPGGRAYRQAPHGPRRGTDVEHRAREPPQRPEEAPNRSGAGRDDPFDPR